MPGRTSSRASPNSRYMSSRQTSPSSRQWPWMVEKFSARSWLNRIRCDLNSASASISLTTPDMCPLLCAVPAGPPAEALELGRELVQAHLDDIRVFRDSAGGDVLHPAVIGDLDLLFLHQRADGRGQGQRAAYHLGPEQAGVGVGVEELCLPVASALAWDPGYGLNLRSSRGRLRSSRGRGGQDARPPGRLQQLPGEEEQVLAFGGQ